MQILGLREAPKLRDASEEVVALDDALVVLQNSGLSKITCCLVLFGVSEIFKIMRACFHEFLNFPKPSTTTSCLNLSGLAGMR